MIRIRELLTIIKAKTCLNAKGEGIVNEIRGGGRGGYRDYVRGRKAGSKTPPLYVARGEV